MTWTCDDCDLGTEAGCETCKVNEGWPLYDDGKVERCRCYTRNHPNLVAGSEYLPGDNMPVGWP